MVEVKVHGEVTCPKCGHVFEAEIEQDVDVEPQRDEGYD